MKAAVRYGIAMSGSLPSSGWAGVFLFLYVILFVLIWAVVVPHSASTLVAALSYARCVAVGTRAPIFSPPRWWAVFPEAMRMNYHCWPPRLYGLVWYI